jgi:prolyl oligopeptidase
MGGVYAEAILRGGGEYGESWHEAGTKTRKQNVFDDFIACAEYLLENNYTSAERLAINGGSNGGLLVAACALQRPELFGAVLAQVGVLDMLRFDRFTIGYAWKPDYGSPSENEEEFRAIHAYSPLHNVKAGVRYPPMMITTGDHDDRVFPAHSFKFAAEMQAAAEKTGAESPEGAAQVLIRVETRAGHGGGMPLSKQLDVTADMYGFALACFAGSDRRLLR